MPPARGGVRWDGWGHELNEKALLCQLNTLTSFELSLDRVRCSITVSVLESNLMGRQMDENALIGLTVLVAEDEYVIATDLQAELIRAGAQVLGPVASLDGLMALIENGGRVDVAILDVNLQGERVFPAAEVLQQQGVPFVFATGYDQSIIPPCFKDILLCEKPVSLWALRQAITTIVGMTRS